MKTYFTSNYKTFSGRTNIHGVGEIYLSPSFHGKLFWIIALTICLGFTTYQLVKAVKEYVSEPYITVIEKIHENEIRYPHLRICYPHWIYWVDFQKALDLNFTKASTLLGLSYFSDIYTESEFNISEAKQEFAKTMAQNNFSRISDFYKAIAKPPPNEYFDEITFLFDFLCYKTNSVNLIRNATQSQKLKTRKDKLQVSFFVYDKNEILDPSFVSAESYQCYIGYFLKNDPAYNRHRLNDKYFLSNFSTNSSKKLLQLPTFFLVDNDMMEIRWDDLLITLHSHATVGKWKNTTTTPCIEGEVSVNSNKTCQTTCQQKAINKNCICSWFFEVSTSGFDSPEILCTNVIYFTSETKKCASFINVPYVRNITTNTTPLNCTLNKDFCCDEIYLKQKEECMKTCIQGCTIWNYYLGYVQRLKLGPLKDVLVKEDFEIQIFFPTADEVLSTQEIDHQSFEEFVGNIGGLLGVWTGASILSLLQFIYLCCCGEFRWCQKGKIKRESTQMTDINGASYVIDME